MMVLVFLSFCCCRVLLITKRVDAQHDRPV